MEKLIENQNKLVKALKEVNINSISELKILDDIVAIHTDDFEKPEVVRKNLIKFFPDTSITVERQVDEIEEDSNNIIEVPIDKLFIVIRKDFFNN